MIVIGLLAALGLARGLCLVIIWAIDKTQARFNA